jgi:hypothetical protein
VKINELVVTSNKLTNYFASLVKIFSRARCGPRASSFVMLLSAKVFLPQIESFRYRTECYNGECKLRTITNKLTHCRLQELNTVERRKCSALLSDKVFMTLISQAQKSSLLSKIVYCNQLSGDCTHRSNSIHFASVPRTLLQFYGCATAKYACVRLQVHFSK